MFEQTFVEARQARPWTVPAAAGGQVALVAAALAIPLIYTEIMPAIQLVTPVVPFRSVAPVIERTVQQAAGPRTASRHPRVPIHTLAPMTVPRNTPIIIDEPGLPVTADPGPAVPMAPGIPFSIGTSTDRPAPPPPEVRKPDPPKHDPPPRPSGPVMVGGDVKPPQLLIYVKPVYPPLARQARIQGQVRIAAILARDGSVTSMQLVSGHPLLVQAALDAVRLWRYRPTLLNGQPVEVAMSVDVNFTLSQ